MQRTVPLSESATPVPTPPGSREPAAGIPGSREPAAGIPAARAPGPSLRPALFVVGLALLLVVLGGLVALLPGSASPPTPVGRGSRVAGVALRAVPAAPFVRKIASAGEPPADVTGSLALPSGARYLSKTEHDRGIGQFDRSIVFSVQAPPSEVRLFYRSELAATRWSTQADSRTSAGYELLGQRNGSDGYQWGVGVVISAIQPTLSPALAGASAVPTSRVTMSIYQVGEAS